MTPAFWLGFLAGGIVTNVLFILALSLAFTIKRDDRITIHRAQKFEPAAKPLAAGRRPRPNEDSAVLDGGDELMRLHL